MSVKNRNKPENKTIALKPLAAAVRACMASGILLSASPPPVHAELPVAADVWAALGNATRSVNGGTMVINQLTDKAILDWKSFNIGAENAVHFNQPAATSVALNRIHQNDPSRIFGALTANGQIYLVNKNGFVFGKNAQVNVNSLVATTLNISEDVFKRGITKAFDQDGTAALQAGGETYLKDAQGRFVFDQNGEKVKIQIFVQPGAQLRTNAPGGRIIIAAPSVVNQGTIETPDGQTILAAATDKVYLQEADPDSGIRGLLVEVETGGDVKNVGKIITERGNATLIGFAVNQEGRVSATTSVSLNGSVRLLAREGHQTVESGRRKLLRPMSTARVQDLGDGLGTRATVELGPNSVTEVIPDSDKSKTAVDAQPQARSKIEISGSKIVLRKDSTVYAPAGEIELTATKSPATPLVAGVENDSRIYMESGSRIDASGLRDVSLPMERNVAEVELRSFELRDSPLQKNGILKGKTVRVDIRDPIKIADISGALARIERNIDERSTAGGTIRIRSEGDVIVKPGAVLDYSGGSVSYRDGYISTTKLISQGRLYDIGEADPNRIYDGVFGEVIKVYEKWGITRRWSIPGPLGLGRFEAGYVEGKPGGALELSGYRVALDGVLRGETVDGRLQRTVGKRVPGSSLTIDVGIGQGRQAVVFAGDHIVRDIGEKDEFPKSGSGSENIPAPLVLDTGALANSESRHVAVKSSRGITIQDDARLALPAGGSLKLTGDRIDVAGEIGIPSGSISLESLGSAGTPTSGEVTLASGAAIDARGAWVNDTPDLPGSNRFSPIAIDGGTVAIKTREGDLVLEAGSRIDVSGGAWLDADGRLTAGRGGDISLAATGLNGASLVLDGDLRGFGIDRSGTLSLTTNEIAIGDGPVVPHAGSVLKPLVLPSDFFQRGGFTDYRLTSNVFGITVTPGLVHPLVRTLELGKGFESLPDGGDLAVYSRIVELPEFLRPAAILSLAVDQANTYDSKEWLTVQRGAEIRTDAGGKVALASDTGIALGGTIDAPSGEISLRITKPNVDRGFNDSQAIWLETGSRLLARGAFKPELDPLGLRKGELLPGGKISLVAGRGYILAQEDSLIDASGSSRTLDILERTSGGLGLEITPRLVASRGGTVNLTAAEGILWDGSFRAASGGANAGGGSLNIELDKRLRLKARDIGGVPFPDDGPNSDQELPIPRVIEVSASDRTLIPDGLAPGAKIPDRFYAQALVESAQIQDGGFASVRLRSNGDGNVGEIRFSGDVSLAAERQIVLDAPKISWQREDSTDAGRVVLEAAYAALGSTDSRVVPAATSGAGALAINAQAIDLIGGASLQGFSGANLNSSGDIRARGIITNANAQRDYKGEFRIAGDLELRAAQIYPATLTDYAIRVEDAPGATIRIESSGRASSPVFSAGGSLTINAPNIISSGVLKAPFGTLTLDADDLLELTSGSLASVSGEGLIVPFGRTQGGLDWIFPLAENNNRVFGLERDLQQGTELLPEKRINLRGRQVALQEGATVDISGSGDLYAFEFVKGQGGSVDWLNPGDPGFLDGSFAYRPSFAVIPGLNGLMTPYDPIEFPGSGLTVGDSVYLAGGSGLPEGHYTLLPAHYALLPGAYLISPEPGTQDVTPGSVARRLDGVPIVAGQWEAAGTAIRDSRWSGFAVETGDIARTRSEYQEYLANEFFEEKAAAEEKPVPDLSASAGTVAVFAEASLSLRGTVLASSSSGGLGGRLDIGADRLAVVGRREDLAAIGEGYVGLVAEELNDLNVGSIMLGGSRSRENTGRRLSVNSRSVIVGSGARLSGQELLLAARENLTIAQGAAVESVGKTESSGETLLVSNDPKTGAADSNGALVRVSSSGLATVTRDKAVSGARGTLTVEAGALLKSSGSILLDSTKDTVFHGTVEIPGGDLEFRAGAISLGEAPAGTGGLVLSSGQVGALGANNLILTSRSDVNIYDGVSVGLKRLTIDAAALRGFAEVSDEARISAEAINLANTSSPATAGAGNGEGTLTLDAANITLGGGNFALSGFRQVALNAAENLGGQGEGNYSADGDLVLAAGRITGASGSTTTIDASGHTVAVRTTGNVPDSTSAPLGAAWSITADAIVQQGRFDLPGGALDLIALTGDILVGAGSSIDLSGRSVKFDDQVRFAPAGRLNLVANSGNIDFASGASVNLAGAVGGGDAGLLNIRAPHGTFRWEGQVTAGAADGYRQGSLMLDEMDFGPGGFSALNAHLRDAGFADEIDLRQRSGDVAIGGGDVVLARRFSLRADDGAVDISGEIDASGTEGGEIEIAARNGIVLGGGARLRAAAHGEGERGGRVTLDTVHPDDAGSGLLDLSASGGLIDVSGGSGGAGGFLHLRSGRDAGGNVAVTDIRTKITGASQADLEATRVFEGESDINAARIEAFRSDIETFMATPPALVDESGAAIKLTPGVEVRGANLKLVSTWDFASDYPSWHPDGIPGYLTLNATEGNIDVEASLTDAFAPGSLPDPFGFGYPVYQDFLQSGHSWSYRLTAANNINLAANQVVRTGTGTITLEAGGDIVFEEGATDSDRAAAVYTVGRPTDGDSDDPAADRRYGSMDDLLVALGFYAEYPVDGGDIAIKAGGNIKGAATGQLMTDWLVRTGDWSRRNDHTEERPTMWGINLSGDPDAPDSRFFNQNVGALGGGNVRVSAGGSVENLSVMVPTTGKPVGQRASPDDPVNFLTNEFVVQGGGNIDVSAGKDLLGGVYFTGLGEGRMQAGGNFGIGANGLAPVVALGSSQFELSARQNLTLGAAFNPTVLEQIKKPDISGIESYFFTYSDASAIDLSSVGGKVTLQNDTDRLALGSLTSESKFAASIYPGTLKATAFSGDISIERSFKMYPAARGQLELLAANNISTGAGGGFVDINMSDADPALLPNPQIPASVMSGSDTTADARFDPRGRAELIHAAVPVHASDTVPVRVVAEHGNIAFRRGNELRLYTPKAAVIKAGGDIRDFTFKGQNLRDDDITVIHAGRDIRFRSPRNPVGGLANVDYQIELAGPGELQLLAGRSIDLGSSNGVSTIGGLFNPALGSGGANIIVQTGLAGKMDVEAFMARYLDSGSYKLDIGGRDPEASLAYFKTLPIERQRRELLKILFNEIRQSASAAAAESDEAKRARQYKRGFDAIQTLFPDKEYQGDLKLFFSKIKTLDGGDIDITVPGGLVNAGLAVAFTGAKDASELGIVVQREGDLNAFVKGDFQVNESRVFTMDGGDIVIWSAEGDIDAGRGAKAAISAPPPITTFDEEGNQKTIFPPIVSGSGIQAIVSTPDKPEGSVILAAPKGVVNAGEAGIRGGQVVIAATAVIGASNIQASQGTVGVPTAPPPPVVPAGVDNSATGAAKQATDQANVGGSGDGQQAQSGQAKSGLSVITTEVIGFGNCSVGDVRDGKAGCS